MPGRWDALRDHVRNVPSRERRRLLLASAFGGSELDATHPSLPTRLDFVARLPDAPATVVLSASESQRIDDERARLDVPIQRALIDRG